MIDPMKSFTEDAVRNPLHLDHRQYNDERLLDACSKYFAVTNMGHEWRNGDGWHMIEGGCGEEEWEGVNEEVKHWREVLAKVHRKNPLCTTIRQLEEAWKKEPEVAGV